jgi:hypothetical protein
MDEEIWKDIEGYEGLYQVSNLGHVKSLRNNIILKSHKYPNGYLYAAFKVKGKCKMIMIHRLVAKSFLLRPEKTEVNHKDGNKENNAIENLEWVTRSENINHALQTGLILKPGDNRRKDWKGYVNIYDSTDRFITQVKSIVAAADWISKNSKYQNARDDNIGHAIRGKNGRSFAYGFKFKRTQEKI